MLGPSRDIHNGILELLGSLLKEGREKILSDELIEYIVLDMHKNISTEQAIGDAHFLRKCSKGFLEESSIERILCAAFIDVIRSPNVMPCVLRHVLWGLYRLTDFDNPIYYVFTSFSEDMAALECLVGLLDDHPNKALPAMYVIGNLVASALPELIEGLLRTPLLETMRKLLQTENTEEKLRIEIYWVLSNINQTDAGNVVTFAALYDILMADLRDAPVDVKVEVIYVVRDSIRMEPEENARKLVEEYDCIPLICELLSFPEGPVILTCLDALDTLLAIGENVAAEYTEQYLYNPYAVKIAECGGLDSLKKMENDARAEQIIKDYFGEAYQIFLSRKRGLATKSARKI